MSETSHAAAAEIRTLLASLIAASLLEDGEPAHLARRGALAAHRRLLDLGAGPEDLAAVKLDGLWYQAMGEAETPGLLKAGLRVSPTLPKSCPVALGELVGPGLALPELEERIRGSASTG